MSTITSVRVRFAPSPTGIMHLGNVRAALINYLFAQKNQGTFVLRIEDTDQERNENIFTQRILDDLAWLGLTYTEGPSKSGPYEPYFQSERGLIYQDFLKILEAKNLVYRCFCTIEDIEKKRQRQIALKQPPRYDRTCLRLSPELVTIKVAQSTPFIWRFQLPDSSIAVHDLARGVIDFDLKNISDFALTRTNGTFTFMFANFVDDLTMKISHVIRGEDHLTNTAGQAALYAALEVDTPVFWHLPIIVNSEGKKLSKRDFGFSLEDLRNAGFLPEAIDNYLTVIGGSFTNEIGSLNELLAGIHFDSLQGAGQITYDVEKLQWINHHWIIKISLESLIERVMPFLSQAYPEVANLSQEKLAELIQVVKPELKTLLDIVEKLSFYFKAPVISEEQLEKNALTEYRALMSDCIKKSDSSLENSDYIKTMQSAAQEVGIPVKKFYMFLRIALTGKTDGLSIKDLFLMLGKEEAVARLLKL